MTHKGWNMYHFLIYIQQDATIYSFYYISADSSSGLLEKYPTFGREKETGLLGALDT